MIKAAINRILELQRPLTFRDADGFERNNITGALIGEPTRAHDPLLCSSLASLLDLYQERALQDGTAFFEIASPSSVSLFDIYTYDGQERKEALCTATAILPEPFPFGRFLAIDDFIIKSCDYFIHTSPYNEMISTVSSVTDFNQADVEDDGLSQTVTVKSGIGRKDRKTVSPFYNLCAYRTFREIAQPEARYLLRIQKGSSPIVGLFEASGYSWKVDAIDQIASYLSEKLNGVLVMK